MAGTRVKSAKGRRAKGQVGEREFFSRLNQYLPAHLQIERNLNQTRDKGVADGSLDYVEIEVKRQERLAIPQWLRQVRDAAGEAKTPVLAYRQNGGSWNILVDMDEFELAQYIKWRDEQEKERRAHEGRITFSAETQSLPGRSDTGSP